MSSLNQVNLIGNLGRAPEVLKSTEKGDFVRLSLLPEPNEETVAYDKAMQEIRDILGNHFHAGN